MFLKKGMCFFLLVTAVLLLGTARGPFQRVNLDKIRADGTEPPPPPKPWPSETTVPLFKVDGTELTPPPIPWGQVTEGKFQKVQIADGTEPPPPPMPWPKNTLGIAG